MQHPARMGGTGCGVRHRGRLAAVPLTLFAHQVPVLPLKIARPRAFDGTALCVGSMAPDLAYPLGPWLSGHGHSLVGIATWAVGCTLMACFAIRRWVAPTVFAHVPDTRWFRLHSYRVLEQRRPPLHQTVVGAVVGAASHVFVDGFTHSDRFGARWLGLDEMLVDIPLRGAVSVSRALQYVGYTAGSLVGVALVAYIGHRRLLERWYGDANVRDARRFVLTPAQRLTFWAVMLTGPAFGLSWAAVTPGIGPLQATPGTAFRLMVASATTTVLACALPSCRPASATTRAAAAR